jgi:hypothetical protein
VTYLHFIWTDEIIDHLAEHGISQEDFERVVCHPSRKGMSRTTRLPAAWGYTTDGRYIMTVSEELDRVTVLPVTAYEVREPR